MSMLMLMPTSNGDAFVDTSRGDISVAEAEEGSCLVGCLKASNISSVDPPTECPQYERTLDCTLICLFRH
ncbi:Hypothetical predicted protein [Drosophila guanche]|nr:Hypothetical predicted protein [Drosophila guanche]